MPVIEKLFLTRCVWNDLLKSKFDDIRILWRFTLVYGYKGGGGFY